MTESGDTMREIPFETVVQTVADLFMEANYVNGEDTVQILVCIDGVIATVGSFTIGRIEIIDVFQAVLAILGSA